MTYRDDLRIAWGLVSRARHKVAGQLSRLHAPHLFQALDFAIIKLNQLALHGPPPLHPKPDDPGPEWSG